MFHHIHTSILHIDIEIVLKCNFPYTTSPKRTIIYIFLKNCIIEVTLQFFRVTSDFFDLSSLLTYAADSHMEGKFECGTWCYVYLDKQTKI